MMVSLYIFLKFGKNKLLAKTYRSYMAHESPVANHAVMRASDRCAEGHRFY